MYLGSKGWCCPQIFWLGLLGYVMGELYRDSIVLAERNLAHLLEELAYTLASGVQVYPKQIGRSIEQTATEVSVMQLAAGGLPVRRKRKYRRHEKRLLIIKEKFEPSDYTLSELVSNWVSF